MFGMKTDRDAIIESIKQRIDVTTGRIEVSKLDQKEVNEILLGLLREIATLL